jgi:DNA-directed RNA polymerase specialized sigma24 family protein
MNAAIPPEILRDFCDPDRPERVKQAVKQLMQCCQTSALAIVCAHVRLPPNEAEDAIQDAWTKALTKRESFCANTDQNFRAWFIVIAKNCGYAIHRKRKKYRSLDTLTDENATPNESDPIDDDFLTSLDDPSEREIDIRQVCIDQLKQVHPEYFDALQSKYLGKDAETAFMAKHQINSAKLYRWRDRAKNLVRACAAGGVS